MAQADGVVANGTGSAVRSDINNQYAALWSNHSGSTEPSSGKVAYQFWADTNTNILKIRNSANNAWINLFTLAGGIDVDAASNFNEDVTFTGASANVTWNKSSDDFIFNDNAKAVFGTSSDGLEVFHDSSNSYISDTGTGYLILKGSEIQIKSNSGQDMAKFEAGGSVELYEANTKAVETISGGIQLNGRSFKTGTFSATGGSVGITHNYWSNNEIGIVMSHSTVSGQNAFAFYNPNGQVGYIQTNDSQTIYSTSSDYRLKENQVPISDGITRLKQLKPYRFNFKKNPTKTLDGFFAHEAQTVVPEAVTGTKDEVATKDEGDRKIGDPIIQGIDQSKLVPLLTAAMQEAITKIETLETKVAALEAK